MENYQKPAESEAIIGDLRYRTKGATLSAVLHVLDQTHGYIVRTPKGGYFLQMDRRKETTGPLIRSEIRPLSIGAAANYYEGLDCRIKVVPHAEAFPWRD